MVSPEVTDPLLPAAPFLTSEAAGSVLAPAIAATGATLLGCRPVQVHYRPGRELVVRYQVEQRLPSGESRQSTILAGTTEMGAPAGCLPVEAEIDDGQRLEVGVWQWPFDPVLPGLGAAVMPNHAERLVAGHLVGPPTLDVVVYRPTERAVVRMRGRCGRTAYVKVVPPAIAEALVARHHALLAAGLPVPEVLGADIERGLIVLAELAGPTLRDLLKGAPGELPGPDAFIALQRGLAAADLATLPTKSSRRADAAWHAGLLATILPTSAGRIEAMLAAMTDVPSGASTSTIHGDLHDGQVIVRDGAIVGLLDIDDVAPGDPVDDLATMLAHLRFREALGDDARDARIGRYADALRRRFGDAADVTALDASTAATLLGLATGPFRIQSAGWSEATERVLGAAERIMSEVSRAAHQPFRPTHHDEVVGQASTR